MGAILTVTETDIARTFGPAAAARGRVYADRDMILEYGWSHDGRALAGTCLGSGGTYRQQVVFRGQPSTRTIEEAHCTCPVGSHCKHVVALLITAAHQPNIADPEPMPWLEPESPSAATPSSRSVYPRWRSVVADMLSKPAAPTPGIKRLALAFRITQPTHYSTTRDLVVRPMIEGARTSWIKTGAGWNDIGYGRAIPAADTQVRLLWAIHRELTVRTYASSIEWLSTTAASSTLWRLIAEAAAAGVELIPAPGSGLASVALGRAQLAYDISEHPIGAVLSPCLEIDAAPVDPGMAHRIGIPHPHGLWYLNEADLTITAIPEGVGMSELDAALSGDEVVIPTADLVEFTASVLPRITRARPVRVTEGLLRPPTISGPVAVLTIEPAGGGGRSYWSIGYFLDDTRVLFDPTGPIGTTPYRESTTESRLWEAIRPDLVSVASSGRTPAQQVVDTPTSSLLQPVTMTTTELAVLCGELLPTLASNPLVRVDLHHINDFRPAQQPARIAFTSSGETRENDWFGLAITVTVGEHHVPIAELISELAAGSTHLLLPNDEYFSLDTPELRRLAELLEEARGLGEIDSDRVSRTSLNATFWEELLELGVVDKQLAEWRKRMSTLAAAAPPRPISPSRRLKATLREYQQDGLNWLSFLWKNGIGGVLADDMGLGKTVQTLALIARAADARRDVRFLVIAPTSVVSNWVAECGRFVPSLRVTTVAATQRRTGLSFRDAIDGAHVVVTSYALLRIMFDDIDEFTWDGVIFDEAQFVKNHAGKTHQCARRLQSPFKLMITGTPMENNLLELWSLISVAAPGLFPSPARFTEYFRKPIESNSAPERLETLRRRIKPIMLRRTKGQVAIDLPSKQEQPLALELSTKHRKIYDTRLARERQKVLGLLGDWEKNRFQVFRSLSMLRQLSLHAGLVDSVHNGVGSTKVDYLVEQLPTLVDEGHSALVFSQFTGFLGIVRAHLDAIGVPYSYLDGSMTARERSRTITQFTSGATQVFLISLKAGGFGLNLTEADYCFVCDPWWNPAAEAQAIDRAHRIGQQRPVNVYRLVSADTIEERVVRLQERKRALFDAVVDDGELFGTALSAGDIRELLA